MAYAGAANRTAPTTLRAPRRRLRRAGTLLATALGAALVLGACSTSSTTTSAPSTTTRSTTPAQALANLETTLRNLESATRSLRTTLLSLEGAALTGGGVSSSDVESATRPVTDLLEQSSNELEAAKPALPANLAPVISSLEGALAKGIIDFKATKGTAGSAAGTQTTAASPVPAGSAVSALINAYLTDVTELLNAEQGAVGPFLSAVGAPAA